MATTAAEVQIRITAEGAAKAEVDLGKVDKSVNNLDKSLGDLQKAMGELAVFGSIAALANKVGKEFAEAQTQALRLSSVAGKSAKAMGEFADQMQALTGESGDAIRGIEARLLAEGKSETMTRKLISAAADMAAITGGGLDAAVQKLSGSLSGQARELAKNNPELKALTEEQLKSGAAIDLIAEKYRGQAKAMSSSLEVSNKVRNESVGDLAEAFGEVLAPAMQAVNVGITTMANVLTNVIGVYNQVPGPIKAVVTVMGGLIAAGIAYEAITKSTLILKAKETVMAGIEIAKRGVQTAVAWAQAAAEVALNAAKIVGLSLTGAGIALVATAVAAGTAYAVSQGQAAKKTEEANKAQAAQNATIKAQEMAIQKTKAKWEELMAVERQAASDRQTYADQLNKMAGAQKLLEAGLLSEKEALELTVEAKKSIIKARIDEASDMKVIPE